MPPGVRASDIPGNRPGDDEPKCLSCGKTLTAEEAEDGDYCKECWDKMDVSDE